MKRFLALSLALCATASYAVTPVQLPIAKDAAGNIILATPVMSLNADNSVNTGGSSGGGAVTVADGAAVNIGSLADTAWTSGSGTLTALGKATVNGLSTINTTLGTPLQAGGNVVVTSSALPSGGATAANQATQITSLATINTTLGTPMQAGGSGYGNVVSGDASYTAGTDAKITLTTAGRLRVGLSSATNIAPGALAASTTGANLEACIYRSGAITMTDLQTAAVSCVADGSLRVSATQSGTWNITNVSGTVSLPTGAATAALQPGFGTAGTPSANVTSIQGVTSGTPVIVGGAVAAGTTDSGNGVKAGAVYSSTLPTYTTGQRTDLQAGTRGSLNVTLFSADSVNSVTSRANNADAISAAATSNSLGTYSFGSYFNGTTWDRARGDTNGGYIQGNVASGAADAGLPVKVGGRYNSTLPTLTDGQRGDLQTGTRSSLNVTLFGQDSATAFAGRSAASDGLAITSTPNNLSVITLGMNFNGTTWDRVRGDTVGTYLVPTPTTAAANAVSITGSSTAVESSRVVCAAACNAYGFQANSGASAGWIMMFNATSAPADGAVTPVKWWQIGANSTVTADLSYGGIPLRQSTGWTLVFSTTGPFTKTASATATFSAESK